MKYFEAIVEFEIEVQTKSATRVKKNKEVYLVQGDSVTFVETKVNEFCKDSHWPFQVKQVRESRISEVIKVLVSLYFILHNNNGECYAKTTKKSSYNHSS